MTAVTSRPVDLMPDYRSTPSVGVQAGKAVAGCRDCGPSPLAVPDADRTSAAATSKVVSEVSRRLGLSVVDSGRGGVDSLASALRGLLARSSAAGQDAVPGVLDAVRGALDEAASALKKLGLTDAQIDSALGAVREKLGASVSASAELSSAQTTTYVRKDKANLDISTQEGDRVQIRFRSREGYVSQTSAGATGGERNVYAFSSGKIEISVDGELNEDELAAIGELVNKVETLANDFFAGDVQKAFESAASLGFDATQIASFALKLSTRETLSQQTTGTPALPAAPKPVAPKPAAPAPLPAPVDPVASDVAASATDAATATPATSPATNATTTAAPATDATTPTTDSNTLPASTATTLGGFLRKLMDTLGGTQSSGRIEFSMKWKLEVVVAAVNAKTPKAEGTPGTKLLAGAVDELAKKPATPTVQDPVTAAAAAVNP